jgi:hypothetical protein
LTGIAEFRGGWCSGAKARFYFGWFNGMAESHAPSPFRV